MERYKTFKDFYPYYLSEHDNKHTKLMHFIGTSIGICIAIDKGKGTSVGVAYVENHFLDQIL